MRQNPRIIGGYEFCAFTVLSAIDNYLSLFRTGDGQLMDILARRLFAAVISVANISLLQYQLKTIYQNLDSDSNSQAAAAARAAAQEALGQAAAQAALDEREVNILNKSAKFLRSVQLAEGVKLVPIINSMTTFFDGKVGNWLGAEENQRGLITYSCMFSAVVGCLTLGYLKYHGIEDRDARSVDASSEDEEEVAVAELAVAEVAVAEVAEVALPSLPAVAAEQQAPIPADGLDAVLQAAVSGGSSVELSRD
jgi:hypothetical protein